MNESEYRYKIDQYLKKYFDIDREVRSICGKSRIDYVLRCKNTGAIFGLEVKANNHFRGEKIGLYLIQAYKYSEMYFNTKFIKNESKILIFISPAISNFIKQIVPESIEKRRINGEGAEYCKIFHKSDHLHSNVNSMIGAFNVGEVRQRKYNNSFYFSFKNKVIWSSNGGLNEKNYKFYTSQL